MTDEVQRVGRAVGLDEVHDVAQAPDMAALDGTAAPTVLENVLEALDKALGEEVDFEPRTLEVVKRPGVAVRYSTDIDDDKMGRWRKQAQDKSSPNNFNNLRFCLLIVATQCEAILMNGQEAHDESGQSFTYGHKWIRERYSGGRLVEQVRAVDAARKLIGSDAHVMVHANDILDHAGYGDEAVEVTSEDGPT